MTWHRGFESIVRQNVPLGPMTTYKVGGPAEFFAEPTDAEKLGALLRRAHDERINVRWLGHGTNLLVSDSGVRGLVLRLPKPGFGNVDCDGLRVRVGAGHSLPGLVKWSVSHGLSGLECLQGVPGTVGAALRMNAGGKHGEIGTSVRHVAGFERDGSPFRFDVRDCGFTYRNSALGGRIVMECELELSAGDAEKSQQALSDILTEKCRTQPMNARSAGCVFKNPKILGVPPAGRLIDELGLKGARVGGASVSMKHANFLICEQGATANDLVQLIRVIRTRALKERSVELHLEVEAWGFSAGELNAVA
ncbi:MAG: UDP-N-acetylmuramate dehydrogenase [Planctomycetota bacterium]